MTDRTCFDTHEDSLSIRHIMIEDTHVSNLVMHSYCQQSYPFSEERHYFTRSECGQWGGSFAFNNDNIGDILPYSIYDTI